MKLRNITQTIIKYAALLTNNNYCFKTIHKQLKFTENVDIFYMSSLLFVLQLRNNISFLSCIEQNKLAIYVPLFTRILWTLWSNKMFLQHLSKMKLHLWTIKNLLAFGTSVFKITALFQALTLFFTFFTKIWKRALPFATNPVVPTLAFYDNTNYVRKQSNSFQT